MSLKKLKEALQEQKQDDESISEEDFTVSTAMIEQSLFVLYGANMVYCKLNGLKNTITTEDIGELLSQYTTSTDKEKLIEDNPEVSFYKFLNWYMNEDMWN
jgi:fructose-1,6-bisphosphatase